VHDYPDVIGGNQPPPLLVEPPSTEDPDQPSLFDVGTVESHQEYELPDRNILRRAPAANELSSDVAERTANRTRADARALRRRGERSSARSQARG
jgi:hypothetical protein